MPIASRLLRFPLILAALLAGSSALTLGDDTLIEIIPLRNRPASDLVRVLEPLAGPGGSVVAAGDRLVIKATPRALAQIKGVIDSLDVAPRSLIITVRQTSSAAQDARAGALAVTAPVGGTTVRTSPHGSRVTTTTTTRTVVTGSFGTSSSDESGSVLQRLQCLEGRPAFIKVGRAQAVPPAFIHGGVVPSGYAEAATGFWVLPRLAGDQVTLELAVSQDAFLEGDGGGTLALRQVRSTVSGRLGDWLFVGGAALDQSRDERSTLGRVGTEGTSDWSVQLQVESPPAP